MTQRPEARAGVADVDLSGKTALVTGSTSGIGREMALALGRLGATVLVHGRDEQRGQAVANELADTAAPDAAFLRADFASQADIRELAEEVTDAVDTLDLLFNNAGGVFRDGTLTGDGVEYTFAVNHLAPFLLTHHLLPTMGEDARVVTTSSGAHRQGGMDFESLRSVNGYSAMSAYCQSKLANILFTRELARRTDLTANCFHPGFVPGSAFFDTLPAVYRIPTKAARLIPGVGTTVESGAARGLYVGVSPETGDVTGEYFGSFETQTPTREARDDETARRLWRVSEEMTGLDDEERLEVPTTA